MLLVCPNCDKKYKMTPEQLGNVGRNVECSNCHHVWFSTAKDLVSAHAPTPPKPVEKPEPSFETSPSQDSSSAQPITSQETEHSVQPDLSSEIPQPRMQDAPYSAPIPPKVEPIAKDNPVFKAEKNTEFSAPLPPQPQEKIAKQKVSPIMPSFSGSQAGAQLAAQRSSVASTPVMPRLNPQELGSIPQPKPRQNQPIHQDMSYSEDMKMFNEGADIFERVEQGHFSTLPTDAETESENEIEQAQESAAPIKSQTASEQHIQPSQSEPSQLADSVVDDKVKESSPLPQKQAEVEKTIQQPIFEDNSSEEALRAPQKETAPTPSLSADEALSSVAKPIKSKSMPFFAPEEGEEENVKTASGLKEEKQSSAPLQQAPQPEEKQNSLEEKIAPKIAPALAEQPATEETITRYSETIVQNLPVIVKQDVNNELREALIRSQQLNSRFLFVFFFNMLLLTGILFLLLLKF